MKRALILLPLTGMSGRMLQQRCRQGSNPLVSNLLLASTRTRAVKSDEVQRILLAKLTFPNGIGALFKELLGVNGKSF